MPISANQGSKVIVQEINLSQVITSASTSVGAQIVVSNQGDTTKPILFTNAQDYLAQYGNPNAKISFDVYCGLDFFKEANQLWALRVAGPGALYASVLMYADASGTTHLAPIPAGVVDPTKPDWPTLLQQVGSGATTAIALFYPSMGQGSYGNNTAISISSATLTAPAQPSATSSSTVGTLPAGTYQYQVSAVGFNGESLASSAEVVVIATGGTTTNSITLSWPRMPLATGYRVYGRTQG